MVLPRAIENSLILAIQRNSTAKSICRVDGSCLIRLLRNMSFPLPPLLLKDKNPLGQQRNIKNEKKRTFNKDTLAFDHSNTVRVGKEPRVGQ